MGATDRERRGREGRFRRAARACPALSRYPSWVLDRRARRVCRERADSPRRSAAARTRGPRVQLLWRNGDLDRAPASKTRRYAPQPAAVLERGLSPADRAPCRAADAFSHAAARGLLTCGRGGRARRRSERPTRSSGVGRPGRLRRGSRRAPAPAERQRNDTVEGGVRLALCPVVLPFPDLLAPNSSEPRATPAPPLRRRFASGPERLGAQQFGWRRAPRTVDAHIRMMGRKPDATAARQGRPFARPSKYSPLQLAAPALRRRPVRHGGPLTRGDAFAARATAAPASALWVWSRRTIQRHDPHPVPSPFSHTARRTDQRLSLRDLSAEPLRHAYSPALRGFHSLPRDLHNGASPGRDWWTAATAGHVSAGGSVGEPLTVSRDGEPGPAHA